MKFSKMVQKLVMVVSLLVGLSMVCFVSEAATPADSQWELYFSDEFNGTELDLTTWVRNSPDLPDEGTYFSWDKGYLVHPDTVSVSDGYLRFDSIFLPEDEAITFNGEQYTKLTSSVTTRGKFEFQYGYAEVRMKYAPEPSGGAFWLMPQAIPYDRPDGHSSPYFNFYGLGGQGSEIDVFEHFDAWHTRSMGNSALHWGGYDDFHESWGTSPYIVGDISEFHTYGVEWSPTELKFYADNVLVGTYNGEAVPQCPEFLVITGGSKELSGPHLVDYVRVYKKKPIILEGTYGALNRYSGIHMTPENGSESANVYQKWNTGSDMQQWHFEYVGDQVYKIKNVATGMYLDVYGAATNNNATVCQYPFLYGFNGVKGLNQLWRITPAEDSEGFSGEGYYRISPLHAPDKFLSTAGNQIYDDVLIQDLAWGSHGQMWKFK